MYLLARWMTAKISIRACGMVRLSMSAVTLAVSSLTMVSSSVSMASVPATLCTVPPKYFSHMATVRLSRLPKSFARSLLMRVIRASLVNMPSLPKGISRSSK